MKELKKANNLQEGAAILLFVSLMTVLAVLFFAMFQSVSISSLRRSMAVSDTVKSVYEAESEVNDIFARFMSGYTISEDEIPPEGKEIKIGDTTTLFIKVTDEGGIQEVEVTAGRLYATNKLRGVRESGSEITDIDIILGLDCTESMNRSATGTGYCNVNDSGCKTRFMALKEALSQFIESIENFEYSDNVHLGILVFRDEAVWLEHGVNSEVKPNSGLTLEQIRKAINNGIGETIADSSACSLIAGTTSVGAPYAKAHEYFDEQKSLGSNNLQVEIVITDGDPNSKNSLGEPDKCNPDRECLLGVVKDADVSEPYARNMLRCVLATKDTWIRNNTETGYEKVRDLDDLNTVKYEIPDEQYGIRDPEIDAYGVTIYSEVDKNVNINENVKKIFTTYLGEDFYYGIDNANNLGEVLDNILEEVLEEYSNIRFYREIPLGE